MQKTTIKPPRQKQPKNLTKLKKNLHTKPKKTLKNGAITATLAQPPSILTQSLRKMGNYGKSPQEVYDDGVAKGILRVDPRQRGTIVELDRLYQRIIRLPPNYRSTFENIDTGIQTETKIGVGEKTVGFFKNLLKKSPSTISSSPPSGVSEYGTAHAIVEKKLQMMANNQLNSVQGMYIHGGVGCGKTMMMDMFFDQIPHNIPRVRKHFHTFMLEIHSKLHDIRQEGKKSGVQPRDPLIKIANEFIEKEGLILCLDEFQVTDVADAMILKELFSGIFAAGGIVISTSNRKPDDLYKNGINRDSFLPFIDILKQRCEIVSMDDMVDYRTLVAQEEGLIHTPLNHETQKVMDLIYDKLAFGQDQDDASHKDGITLDVVMGRTFHVRKCVPSRVARFQFPDLCDRALGAADYLAIAKEFPCILLENIPVLYTEDSVQLRRFITLLDVLYEHRTKVYISAETTPDMLFQPTIGKDQVLKGLVVPPHLMKNVEKSKNDQSSDQTKAKKQDDNLLAQFAHKDEVFASARALSRLTEMMSTTYLSGEFHTQGSKDTKSNVRGM
jgi:predicted ATPase